jgi:hypothetical protein
MQHEEGTMAQAEPCNHAYGLHVVRCAECGSQIGARCPTCAYEGRNDDHAVHCSHSTRVPGRKATPRRRKAGASGSTGNPSTWGRRLR